MAPLHTREQVKKGPRRQKDHTVSPYVEPPASAFRMENVSYLQGRKVRFEPYRPQAVHRLWAHNVQGNPSSCWNPPATGSGAMLKKPKYMKGYLTKGPDRSKVLEGINKCLKDRTSCQVVRGVT